MKTLFDKLSVRSSRMVTRAYSTSFSLGIRFLNKQFREPVYSIYGFARLADEIVNSFHDQDQQQLLSEFKRDTYHAIERGISLNPILNSFQKTVNEHHIDLALVEAFLDSIDLELGQRSDQVYIPGNAETAGLMCLKVFVEGDSKRYEELKDPAMALGSAFRKINFLRDLYTQLHADYLNAENKKGIERDIEADLDKGLEGIRLLSKKSRLGVYVTYMYHRQLFYKIKALQAGKIQGKHIRIPNSQKMVLFAGSYVRHSLNLL